MPTAVAISASAMPLMTLPIAPIELAAQLAEGGHDAEHRAEEADERRVVAERAEKQQAGLERLAPQPGRLGQDLLDRLRALVVPVERLADDRRLDRLAAGQHLAGRGHVSLGRTPCCRRSDRASRLSRRRRKYHQRSMITPIDSTDSPSST